MARYAARSRSGCSTAPRRTRAGCASTAIAQLLDDRTDVLRLDRLPVAVVDGDDRRRRAAAEALGGAQGDLAVGRRLAGPDVELALERLEHGLRVHEPAAHVRAHLDRVAARGLEVEHVVEARDRHAVRGCQVERLADLLDRLRREPAVLFLREAQRRQDRRLRVGVTLCDLLDLGLEAHRSVSPMTASSEPTIAIRSAMSAPFEHVAVACSAANDGARKCTRQGFGPPSLTT